MNIKKEKVLLEATLLFFIDGRYVILATKAKKIGAGLLNTYGGGVEKGESPRLAALREAEEETENLLQGGGVTLEPRNLEKVAVMIFHNTTEEKVQFDCKVHVYITRKWVGRIVSTEDMLDPQRYLIENLPFDKMMLADRFWVPPILRGQKIFGSAYYGPRQETLLKDVEILHVSNISDF